MRHANRLVEHGRAAAEALFPEPRRDQRHRRHARRVLLGTEHAADRRLGADRRQKVLGDEREVDPLGLSGDGDVHFLRGVDGDLVEDVALGAPVEVIGKRHVRVAGVANLLHHGRDQARRLGDRQRAQEERADDGEDAREQADGETDGENRRGGERGRAAKLAQSVANVLHQRVERRQPPDVARALAGAQHAAERPLRRGIGGVSARALVLERLTTPIDVEAQLLLELALESASAEQERQSSKPHEVNLAPAVFFCSPAPLRFCASALLRPTPLSTLRPDSRAAHGAPGTARQAASRRTRAEPSSPARPDPWRRGE